MEGATQSSARAQVPGFRMTFFHEQSFDDVTGRTIILDIDGTLVASGETEVSHEARATLVRLREKNTVYLCSNNYDRSRTKSIAESLQTPFLRSRKKKPDPRLLRDTTIQGPLLVIGDKCLTDELFALFTGAEFLRVSRIKSPKDSAMTRFLYFVDDIASFFMKAIKRLT